jgi:hypothetical protein
VARPLFLAWMAIILAPSIAKAQSPASFDLKGSIGYTGVFDDDAHHLHTSAAVRLYLTERFSIEPEVQYLRASLHDDGVIVANANLDFRRGRRVIPYVSGGIGVANGSVFAQGGVGTKIMRGSWFIAPDVRFGYYYHIRASVGFGYAFGAARR